MPIYQVEAPDGKIIEVEGPENAPQDQIVNFAISNYLQAQKPVTQPAPAAPEPEQGDFMRGVKSWLPGFQETLGGAQVLAGKAIGSEGIMQAGIERTKAAQAAQKPKETDEFTNAWEKGIGTVLTDWLPYQLGAGVGNIAESVAFAGIGSLLGGTLGGGVGAVPGAAAGFLEKSLVKEGVKKAAKEIMEKEGKEAAEAYVAKAAAGEIEKEAAGILAKQGGKYYGTIAGMAGQAGVHGMGETTSRALQEAGYDPSQLDMSTLLPAVGIHSVADFVSERILLGGFKGMAGIPEKSTNKFVYDVLKGAATTGAKEIVPETVQSAAERFGAKLSLSDAEAMSEYLNTATAAFAMSVIPGGVGGARTYMGRAPQAPTPEAVPETVTPTPEVAAPESAPTPEGVPTPEQVQFGPSEGESIREIEKEYRPIGEPAPVETVEPVTAPTPQEAAPQPAPIEQVQPTPAPEQPPVQEPIQEEVVTEKPTAPQYSVEQQDAINFIKSVDEGGVPLNPLRIRKIAEGLGLEVSKSAAPEETVQRIRDAVVRFEQQPIQEQAPVEAPFETRHQIEKELQEGSPKEYERLANDAAKKGINYDFTRDGNISLRNSKVDWDVMAKMRKADRLLNHIRDYVPLDTRQIIDRITPYVKDIPISFNNSDVNNPKSRYYGYAGVLNTSGPLDAREHKVQFFKNSSWGNSFEIIVHELVHGATVRNYYKGRNGDAKFMSAAQELDELAAYLVKNHSKEIPFFSWYKTDYIKKNGDFKSELAEKQYLQSVAVELLSWGTVDRKTQDALKNIKLPDGQSAWSKFVETMRKLLNIPKGETNALTKIIDLQDKLIGGETAKPMTSKRRATSIRGGMEREFTPEFRKWFGNSKVVDENGNPLVVYHGTNKDFQFFTKEMLGSQTGNATTRLGFFFSDSPEEASRYAKDFGNIEGGQVIPAYLSIKNPKRLTYTEFNKIAMAAFDESLPVNAWKTKEGLEQIKAGQDRAIKMADDLRRQLKSEGYDGAVVKIGGKDEYIAFEPNQIKSVFNERPTEAPEILGGRTSQEEMVGPPERQVEYNRQNIEGEKVKVPVREAFTLGDPEQSWWSNFTHHFVYDYIDKYVDLKKLIAAINSTVKRLDPKWDAYMRETLYHSRVSTQTAMFLKNELDPLAKEMVARGVSEEELNAYLMARHAKEYNDVINERNPDNPAMQHRGSGIHDMVAEAYVNGATKEQIQQIRDALESIGGLTKNEQLLLNEIPKMTAAKRKALQDLSKKVDSIIHKTQRVAVAGGVEKKSTIDYWNDMYKHYVPFKRSQEEMDFAQHLQGPGRGFSATAKMGRASTGSLKTIDNILSNVVLQRDMAIVKAEKARVGRAIYVMAMEHPNPDIYLAVNPNAGVMGKENDALMQLVKDRQQLAELNKSIENRMKAGENVEDSLMDAERLQNKIAADTIAYKKLKEQADRARQSIIDELKKFGYDSQGQGLDADTIENIIREPQGAFYNPNTKLVEYRTNSFLRNSPNVLAVPVDGETRYVFFNTGNETARRLAASLKGADVEQLGKITAIVSKFTRWIAQVNTQYNPFFGIINMMRDIQGAQFNLSTTALAGNQMAVNRNIYPAIKTIWQSLRGDTPSGPFALEWQEFMRRGGMTGVRDMLVNIKKEESALSDLIAEYQRNPSSAAFHKTTKAVFGFMSTFNDTMENAVRLAAFIEAKKKFNSMYKNADLAADKAAELAKNLTVNFNRKGAKTQLINSWYAFFNASLQGSARLYETMKGPAGKKILGSLTLLGVIQQLMLSGFDDDDPPEFVRERNLVIPTSDGKYISWPMPLGFSLFVNVGRLATSTLMGGGDNIAKNIGNMFTVVAESVNPVGGGSLVQAAAPTVLDPAVALYGNVDAFGRPIYREDRPGKPVPGYLRSTEGATDTSRWIAKMLNYMSGGTEFQKGEISPTADQIDYLAGQLGGGTYREARKVGEFVSNQITGEETAPYRVPLAGRFIGDTGSEANVRNKFYQNVQTMAGYEAEIKGRMKQGTAGEFLKEHPEARMYQAANTVENQITQINKVRKQLVERGASKEQLKQLNDHKIELMRRFNAMYEQATK